MLILTLILLLLAAVLFALAAVNVPARFSLIAAGLLAWVMVPLIHAIRAVGG